MGYNQLSPKGVLFPYCQSRPKDRSIDFDYQKVLVPDSLARDLAPQRPNEIKRTGDEQPGVGLGREFSAAAKSTLRVRLGFALRPSDAASACSSAGARPRLDPGRSVNTIVEARLPSSARKPRASLSTASATTATHGPERSGVRARSPRTASRLNGTCAPSSTTGRRLDRASMSKRSMRPGRCAAARVSASRSQAPTAASPTAGARTPDAPS